jgi:outer membrane receptor for ferric coprogen and ferric-rhodotorulic acid
VANALLGYRVNESLSINFNANNLFDKTYYARLGGTNSYNTYGDPRNYSLSARFRF